MTKQQINELKESFTGTKTVNAVSMNRADYNTLRGWKLPDDENGTDEGYLVEYPDSDSNVEGFEGYISWISKDVFERTYHKNIPMVTDNTVKLAAIEEQVVDESYTVLPSGKVTVCELILRNGFVVTGEAAVVDKANFNMEIAKRISRQNAIDKLFPVFAYLLCGDLTQDAQLGDSEVSEIVI